MRWPQRPGLWRALPREVAAWWRDRDRDRATPARGEAGIATLAEDGSVAFAPESVPSVSLQGPAPAPR